MVHLLNGDAVQFTTAYLTARLAKSEPAASAEPAKPAEPAPEPKPDKKPAKRTPSPRPRAETPAAGEVST